MAKFDFAKILDGVEGVVAAVEKLAPLAVALGAPAVVANVATIAIAATGTLQNIVERATDAKEALATQDETKLRTMLSRLQAVNDTLAGTIASDTEAATAQEPPKTEG
jgi:hypothetical protein